jgi:GNAT superfamily N-acetyltransferase
MIEQNLASATTLHAMVAADRPNAEALAGHLAAVGVGNWWLDRTPAPRVIAVEVAGNWLLRGDPRAVSTEELRELDIRGFVDAPAGFAAALRSTAETVTPWDRVLLTLDRPAAAAPPPPGTVIRKLVPDDAAMIADLAPSLSWISKTWGGPEPLAASGYAWGAFLGPDLASVACTFLLGQRNEEIGVVTEPSARRQGLSAACAARLCAEIQQRGRRPSWSTSTDNAASIATARSIGCRRIGRSTHYLVDIEPPN